LIKLFTQAHWYSQAQAVHSGTVTISHYNGFFKLVEELLQIHSCFSSHSTKQRVLGGHAPDF